VASSETGRGTIVQMWNLETRSEIGRYRIEADFAGLSFSADCRYLLPDPKIGALPNPPVVQAASQGALDSRIADMEAAESCLHVGPQWVHQGFEDLLWLPPAYRARPDCLAVRGGTIVLGVHHDMVLFIKIDLAKTPLASRRRRLMLQV
jgi:hypothetical protein